MGCTNSKLDDLPAVALCKERCAFLDEAINLRFALAEAHLAYIHSLKQVGHSLHSFIQQGVAYDSSVSPPSPKLNLPSHRKGDPVAPPPSSIAASKNSPLHHLSHSNNSDSHLHFLSDSDDESSSLHHSDHSSPLHPTTHGGYADYMASDQGMVSYPGGGGGNGGFLHMNYMQNKATPSVVYEQRVMSPERVYHMGESSSSSSSYYGYDSQPYSNMNPSSYPYSGYPSSASSSLPPGYGSMSPQVGPTSSKSPPPPPPPRTSAWEFLNLFQTHDSYYNAYTPSRDSKEVRDEEGIPDLEEESYPHEVVKEVYGDHNKFVDNGNEGGGKNSNPVVNEEEVRVETEASLYQTRPSSAVENDGMEYEVHVMEKKVVDNGDKPQERSSEPAFMPGSRDVYEIAKEIEVQFERASDSGNEIAKILEVGKRPYQRKLVTSKMLHSSQPSTSGERDVSSEIGIGEEMAKRSGNLSSTLHKLHLWEKKLYHEVKAEEKMRVIHEQKCRRLKRLDERGADAHKVEATQTLIRSLSTKMRISIQVVDKISVTINRIRDEELWPQLHELIRGLTKMWKCMLECHHIQHQAIREARSFAPIGSGKKHGEEDHLGPTLQLQHELINWTSQFSSWISAQKGYVHSLNNWLLKCLLYEPEETPDGPIPFSPGRLGAPLVFIICHQWSQALDTLSEKQVVDSMRVLTMSVLQIWENDKLELRQRLMANKDMERKVRNLDKEDQRIQKELQALDKKASLVSGSRGNGLSLTGNVVFQSDTSRTSLQAGLQCIFEAMERFTADCMKTYEELLQRSEEEEKISQEQERDS